MVIGSPLRSLVTSSDPALLHPSARTLDAALQRLLRACSRAEHGARETADEMERSEPLLSLVRHRRDAVSLIESVLGIVTRERRAGSEWVGRARFTLRALRGMVIEPSDGATYAGQVALADGAIAACNDLLRMFLPERTRRNVERVHASLESDRRRLRRLAQLE
jgi:hypothetical protein